MKIVPLLVFCGLSALSAEPALFAQEPDGKGPYVVLKFDDLTVKGKDEQVRPNWNKLVAALERRKIKGSIGVICNGLEFGNPNLEKWVKEQNSKGTVEFWNHGMTHVEAPKQGDKRITEFSNVPLEEQVETLRKSQTLAKERLGIELAAFGSPFNTMDANTPKALAQFPEIKVWFYGRGGPDVKQLVLGRPIDLEYPTMKPNFEKFKAKYESLKDCKVMALQGHPAGWSPELFAEFEKVLDYLMERKAVFVTPSEYYNIVKGAK